jgi:2-(3-amino-3-carboxypropyl)histidine synthase
MEGSVFDNMEEGGDMVVQGGNMTPVVNKAVKKAVRRVRPVRRRANQIPDEILNDVDLKEAMAMLPSNYNFEIPKSIWKIRVSRDERKKKHEAGDAGPELSPFRVALQFPEGLLMYSCIIHDILVRFTGAEVFILGDVTYGACCVDDFTADKLGAHFLIHYGHSCLVPVGDVRIGILYVFVEIRFDATHAVACVKETLSSNLRVALMGTIQFGPAVNEIAGHLKDYFKVINVPQAKPLSMGETLGCTAPQLRALDALVFVADGRFHLEAALIQNPGVTAYRYDPYQKTMTIEGYDIPKMKDVRWAAIQAIKQANRVGLILGTLGRQGSPHIFNNLRDKLEKSGLHVIPFLMAELNPKKLEEIGVDAWVQVSCPRLSIDWSDGFTKPILTPYETEVALGHTEWKEVYPMDYYSTDAGAWGNMSYR